MSVDVLLVTHPGVGTAMLNTANRIMGTCCLPTQCLEVPSDAELEPIIETTRAQMANKQPEADTLILTDLFGATPHNLAQQLNPGPNTCVISGLNLSMLIRVFDSPDDDLNSLVAKALEGGVRGVQTCRQKEP